MPKSRRNKPVSPAGPAGKRQTPKPSSKKFMDSRSARAVRAIAAKAYPKCSRYWAKPKPIKVSQLVVGDVMMSKGPPTLRNAIGGLLTGTPFSHAAVYVGEGKFIDMSARVVREVSAKNALARYREPFIFRANLSQAQQQEIARNARQMIGVPFSKVVANIIRFSEASGIKIRKPRIKGHVCTTIVADVFHRSGVDLTPGVHPLRAGPLHLLKGQKLKPIN